MKKAPPAFERMFARWSPLGEATFVCFGRGEQTFWLLSRPLVSDELLCHVCILCTSHTQEYKMAAPCRAIEPVLKVFKIIQWYSNV